MHSALRIAQLLRLLGRVDGRKKLQKLVHILQELGYPFPERFEYSYYGMFSKQLRGELDALAADKLITEREVIYPSGNPSFSFESTPQLEALLTEVGVDKEPSWAGTAKRLNALSAHILEGVSTILFLHRRGLEGDQLKQRLLSLKPHLADCWDQCERETRGILALKPTAAPAPAIA